MRPLTITHVSRVVPRCCKGNAICLERLSCDNEWLIHDVCLSSECRSCEGCDLCPIQDIEVVIDWFSDVGAIKMSNSPIGVASAFSCPLESVDWEVCCARTFSIVTCWTFYLERDF